MNTINSKAPGKAERFGSWLARTWRGYLGCGHRVVRWLVAHGVPNGAAIVLLWVVKLAMLALVLYFVFWFALLFVVIFLVVRGLANNKVDSNFESGDEVRHGEAGYGLYTSGGQRIDPHNPNNLNDLNDPYNQ